MKFLKDFGKWFDAFLKGGDFSSECNSSDTNGDDDASSGSSNGSNQNSGASSSSLMSNSSNGNHDNLDGSNINGGSNSNSNGSGCSTAGSGNGNGGSSNGSGSNSGGSSIKPEKESCRNSDFKVVARCILKQCTKSDIICKELWMADSCIDRPQAIQIEECIRDVRAEIYRLEGPIDNGGKLLNDFNNVAPNNGGKRKRRFLFVSLYKFSTRVS